LEFTSQKVYKYNTKLKASINFNFFLSNSRYLQQWQKTTFLHGRISQTPWNLEINQPFSTPYFQMIKFFLVETTSSTETIEIRIATP
ncbi:MAG: hypothetical protein Q8835_03105, partial [Sweet potato little leaf phytoplasma]|nr:hypothetical protein [Sweet potato little leaf phytoplasma]